MCNTYLLNLYTAEDIDCIVDEIKRFEFERIISWRNWVTVDTILNFDEERNVIFYVKHPNVFKFLRWSFW